MRRRGRYSLTWLVAPFALVLAGCGGESGSGPEAEASLERAAYRLRYEGALWGPAALPARLDSAEAPFGPLLGSEDDAASFLAASRYQLLCQEQTQPLVAFHSPFYDSALLSRWSQGEPPKLAHLTVVSLRALGLEAEFWLDALLSADRRQSPQAVLESIARAQVAALQRPDLCKVTSGNLPDQVERPTLLGITEIGAPLRRLNDRSSQLGMLHRALHAQFNQQDSTLLTDLLHAGHAPMLTLLRDPPEALHLMPTFLRYDRARERAEAVIVYADLLLPGRYVVAFALLPAGGSGAANGGTDLAIEFVRLPLSLSNQ